MDELPPLPLNTQIPSLGRIVGIYFCTSGRFTARCYFIRNVVGDIMHYDDAVVRKLLKEEPKVCQAINRGST